MFISIDTSTPSTSPPSSQSATLTSRSNIYPEWMLGMSRCPTLPSFPGTSSETVAQQTDSEITSRTVREGPGVLDGQAETPSLKGASLGKSTMEAVEEIIEKRRARLVHFPGLHRRNNTNDSDLFFVTVPTIARQLP